MQTEIILANAHPAEEIGYVTKHFRDLQGLRMAVIWTTALLFQLATTRWIRYTQGQLTPLFVAGISVSVASFFLMPRWYRHRYGFLEHSARPKYYDLALKIGVFAFLGILGGSMLLATAAQLERLLIPGLWILSMVFLFLGRACERIPSIPSVQLRSAIALVVVATALTYILHIPMDNAPSYQIPLPMLTVLILAYLYDHWLLQHLLGRKRSPEFVHD